MMNNDDVRDDDERDEDDRHDEARYLNAALMVTLAVMRMQATKLADRIAEAERAACKEEHDLARGTLLRLPGDLAALRAMYDSTEAFHTTRRLA